MGDTAKMKSHDSAADTSAKKEATPEKSAQKKTSAKRTPAPNLVARQTVTHSLTPQKAGGGAERRVDERHEIHALLEVDIELFGYQREGRAVGRRSAPDASKKIHSFGRTVNLSISGMLAEVADVVTEGSNCLVRFVNADAGVRPELRWGLVVRCDQLESGKYQLAVRFDSPLEHLDVKALEAA